MAEADYYTVLGINRTANEDDIKKAYRKMALQWHPDKNPDNKEEAERRFKVISEAYQVLSDANKRSAYDRYGKSGSAFASGGQFNFHFQSPADLFQQFFGGGDGLSFLFGHHGSSNGHFNMNSHRGYQSPPIRVFTFSPGSAGFPFQMEGTYFDNPFCNSPFHSGGSDEDDFYRDMGRLHSPYGSDAQKLCQSTVNTINGQKVVTTIEVDGLEETITVETDGVITSRTVNGVEQCASQNMHHPSFHRSTVPRTLRARPTEGHSTDRLRFCGAPGSSGCSASSFPNSASNSFLFKDSKKRSTGDSYTARPTSPPVVSSSVRLERKDAPASKEVPVHKESPAPKEVSVQKEVPTGKEAAERKEVPAVRKLVPAGLEVAEGKEIPVQTEDLMQEKGKEVGQHPDLQGRRDNDVPKSSGVPECRLVSDRNEVAETDGQRIYAESLSALSSKSNRKTLLYSRVACNSQIRIVYEVKLL